MKRNLIFVALILTLAMFMVSCTSLPEPAGTLLFEVTNWNAGPAVEGATVKVFESGTANLIGSGVTNELGAVAVEITGDPERVDVKVTKQGHARSLVQGLKLEAANRIPFGILLMTAQLNSDPTTETDPVVDVSLFEIAPVANATRQATPIDMEEPITGPFTAKVEVTANNFVNSIYEPLIDRIAGAGLVTTDRQYVGDATEAEFDISPTGHDGEVALYTTVYDKNNNRVLKVDYLTIEGTDPGEVTMYQPMTFADFSSWYFMDTYALENIWAYTRRSGISLYNEPRGITEIEQTGNTLPSKYIENAKIRSLDSGNRIAPDGGNLWSHLYFTDWTTANLYYGAYPTELPNPGDMPDGYNLYFSTDGEEYEKFGFVTEDFVSVLANTILYYVGGGYNENQIMNLFPSYKDPSIFLHPGAEMHYQVTSVYGTLESTPTDLGSVVPLDSFNVALENPAHESVNVSQTPNFRWRATKPLESSEGPVTYNYRMFIYDWIQSANGLITPVDAAGDFVDFQTDSAGPIVVGFTGDEVNTSWNCIWNWYNPYGDFFEDYTANKLEPNKTYNWGVNIAYALVKDADSRAYSIAADFKYRDTGWYYDPVMMEPDLHADFTTGAQ